MNLGVSLCAGSIHYLINYLITIDLPHFQTMYGTHLYGVSDPPYRTPLVVVGCVQCALVSLLQSVVGQRSTSDHVFGVEISDSSCLHGAHAVTAIVHHGLTPYPTIAAGYRFTGRRVYNY